MCFEKIKVIIEFEKVGDMKYISHLDMARALQRAFRMAGAPLYYTKGFNPRPKFSFDKAVKVGVEIKEGVFTLLFSSRVELVELVDRVNSRLPEGLSIKKMSYG